MILANGDEAKRSKLWKVTTIISTVIIILVAGYFLMKMFVGNPLEGSWSDEDGRYTITFASEGIVTVSLDALSEANIQPIDLEMSIDKKAKEIQIEDLSKAELAQILETCNGSVDEKDLQKEIDSFASSYTYSIDRNELTLTDREYGKQMIFTKN